jgi:hypothetical protein
MTRRSHRMQKYKFDVTCPGTFFAISVPPEHEKYCVNVSLPGCTGIHYVAYKSHRMQKHKSANRDPVRSFVKSYRSYMSMKNTVSRFGPWTHQNALRDPTRFLSNPYLSHPSKNNSESMFHSSDALQCTM